MEDHIMHLEMVFGILKDTHFYLKKSKCAIAVERVEYLGHFIAANGVSTDPNKVSVVQNWIMPTTLKQLRGFLGLSGYYRRFIKGYGQVAKPLTDLLKKDKFTWTEEATSSFTTLKQLLCTALVLALPDFNKTFVIETDASGYGIGVVLMQDGHPIAFFSKALGPKNQAKSAYERELIAVVMAVQKWSPYLLNRHFIIKTDQKSLKNLLEQRISNPCQQDWMAKLMGYDFEIQYKQGQENKVADALSRHPPVTRSEILHITLNQLTSDLLQQLQNSWKNDTTIQNIIADIQRDPNSHKYYSWTNDELRRKGKLVIGLDTEIKKKLLYWGHNSAMGGHSGRDATVQRLKSLFNWSRMFKDVQTYIRSCDTCQRCKYDNSSYPGLLQPLPIPTRVWSAISMDFIEGLPKSHGKEVILVVVDRLSKAAHFLALSHPFTALDVAQVYLDNIYKLHGLPDSIVSDRDSIFLSDFWNELFRLQGVELLRSTVYHPQTDGQTEVVNKCLESYLRCMCNAHPISWSKWLALAEWWYITSFHTATQSSPYEILYGQTPPLHLPYLPGESKNEAVDRSLVQREAMMKELQFQLQRSQNRMKQQADAHRTERVFQIGDWVYLKLKSYRQTSVASRPNQKLAPKYYGPFRIVDTMGHVAYKLALPSTSQIHNVFHVSQLKKCYAPTTTAAELPTFFHDSNLPKLPEVLLERKMVKRRNMAATEFLVKWQGLPVEDATWMFADDFCNQFPDFHL